MQKIVVALIALLLAYLAYRYVNMKPVDAKAPEVAQPNEPESVPTVSIDDKEDMDKEE